MTHKARWRGLVCFALCSVLFLHTALPLFDSLLEQNAAGCAGTMAVAAVCWPLSFSTSAAYFQAHFRRLSKQHCFKSPELTATNIRVQNSLSMLPVREDRRMCQHNIEARSRSRCCRGKAVHVTCFACVFAALVIQLVKPMRHVVTCLALTVFSTLSHKGRISRWKKLLNVNCVFWFSVQHLFETFLILGGVKWDINVHRSWHKYPLFLSDF